MGVLGWYEFWSLRPTCVIMSQYQSLWSFKCSYLFNGIEGPLIFWQNHLCEKSKSTSVFFLVGGFKDFFGMFTLKLGNMIHCDECSFQNWMATKQHSDLVFACWRSTSALLKKIRSDSRNYRATSTIWGWEMDKHVLLGTRFREQLVLGYSINFSALMPYPRRGSRISGILLFLSSFWSKTVVLIGSQGYAGYLRSFWGL